MATIVPSRALTKSLALHALVLVVLLLMPAGPLRQTVHPEETEVVFHRPPPPVEIPPLVLPRPTGPALAAGPKSAAPAAPKAPTVEPTISPGGPIAMDVPGVPEGPQDVPIPESPKQKAAKSGLLALRDQFASLATEKDSPKLGAAAHLGQADDSSRSASGRLLAAGTGGSGGINMLSLSRDVGGGGGGGAGGGGGMHGVSVGRATSSIAGIGGGGGPRALGGGGEGSSAGGGPSAARTDEEIQIVFDRHKASFYRLYHRELRNDPSLRGQMVLRLTIEPDGSVSMCALQSSDMKAPDLASQVVARVREINFGAKEGVKALTIVYPIDFLPAA